MPQKIALNVKCMECNRSLMDFETLLNSKQTVKVGIKNESGETGFLWLSSIYGCFDKQSAVELRTGSNIEIFCPHCNSLLNSGITCSVCGDGKMVKLYLEIGGIINICSKIGCTNHYVKFSDLENAIRKLNEISDD